ncbi:MAG: precorrin-3B C(17)-methyltransferase [Symploca sp. SIO2E6]|nr:precorrin-3B C(17)-methyltransferase [Symploca sp. SIO2E6]
MSKLFQDFQPLAAIATTPTAAQRLQPLGQTVGATLWVPESLTNTQLRSKIVVEPDAGTRGHGDAEKINNWENTQVYTGSLKNHIASLWPNHRAFVFCLATGAVVRLIAPLLQDKSCDPAVVVVDQAGRFVISLSSGHQGGADQLAQLIAQQLGATAIITGAVADLGLPGIDVLGVPFGWCRGAGDWTKVSAAVACGEKVQVIQEAGSCLWQSQLPASHPFVFGGDTEMGGVGTKHLGDNLSVKPKLYSPNTLPSDSLTTGPKARIWISPKLQSGETPNIPEVQWHPRVLWVGIGCERGTSKQLIEQAIQQTCQDYQLAELAIAGIATIDLKADEVGLLEFCEQRHFPLRTFPAQMLNSVKVPTPSTIVAAEVGTPSVAEATAICASLSPSTPVYQGHGDAGTRRRGERTTHQNQMGGLLVPKQIFKSATQPGAVTVAIAQAEVEYTGRTGQLFLIGTGPGQLEQMTLAAKTAVVQADAVIGYSLYLDLISSLRRPGQIIEALPITQERQRANRAIELAQWGLTVAVISSGDCGIYGMAGLVLEELRVRDWDGKIPGVQLFPGITALQAAASRVGVPLMHDFCAISLSDLLTPWEVIAQRLEAAAQADFVTALYNPRSRSRTQQIAIAQATFLKYRHPQTPVAIVRCAYREDEQITLTTLDKMLDIPIDMLTTVLIGNQSTAIYGDWMITPRGYLGFAE